MMCAYHVRAQEELDPMRVSNREAAQWLHRLDAYTNAEFGRARTLSAIQDLCVACGRRVTTPSVNGLCPQCVAQRQPETANLILWRPRRIAGARVIPTA
jgi:hypothetical protein